MKTYLPIAVSMMVLSAGCVRAGFDLSGQQDDGFNWPEGGAETAADRGADIGSDGLDEAVFDWVPINGGAFEMGSTAGQSDERPPHPVTVPSFEMLRTEVTVAQYHRCVSAGNCTEPAMGTFSNWNDPVYRGHPVNFVTWYQAVDFCEWAGWRLPTEAEWEYAARSRGKNVTYPWGEDDATCEFAVMEDDRGTGCGTGRTWPVCSKPAGRSSQGLCDLVGNASEWVQERYHPNYDDAPADGSAWENGGTDRCKRGGDLGYSSTLRATNRSSDPPERALHRIGLRCVRPAA